MTEDLLNRIRELENENRFLVESQENFIVFIKEFRGYISRLELDVINYRIEEIRNELKKRGEL